MSAAHLVSGVSVPSLGAFKERGEGFCAVQEREVLRFYSFQGQKPTAEATRPHFTDEDTEAWEEGWLDGVLTPCSFRTSPQPGVGVDGG